MDDDKPHYDNVTYTDLPSGWGWWSGETSQSYYTRWFGTEYRMGGHLAGKHGLGGYEGEVYWDKGGDHHVQIYPIKGFRDDGDPDVSEYAVASGTYETMQEAIDAIPELIAGL